MSTGVPMSREESDAVIAAVECAAGPERIRVAREAHNAFHPVWEAMTDEERARWVMGEGWVE